MPYSALDAGQREAASTLLADEPQPTLKCLTLLATIGSEPDWNDRTKSRAIRRSRCRASAAYPAFR